jgi:hypothetical protein
MGSHSVVFMLSILYESILQGNQDRLAEYSASGLKLINFRGELMRQL